MILAFSPYLTIPILLFWIAYMNKLARMAANDAANTQIEASTELLEYLKTGLSIKYGPYSVIDCDYGLKD